MSTVNLENKTILVTGAAGFIGSNLVKRIYEEVPSATVIGIDNAEEIEMLFEVMDKYFAYITKKGYIGSSLAEYGRKINECI